MNEQTTSVNSSQDAAQAVANQFPGATPADKEQIAAAAKAKGAHQILSLVQTNGKVKFNDEGAEKGKTLILDTVKQTASITKRIFEVMRLCEDEEEVVGTFQVAEYRALKRLADMQEMARKEATDAGKRWTEKPIKTLKDLADIYGNAGVISYQTTLKRLINAMKDADRLCRVMQDWFTYQAKHDGEPMKAVQTNFLNIWSQRYAGSTGWREFTADVREAQGCEKILEARIKKDEAAKGSRAATQIGEHVAQTLAQMGSGTRERGGHLADSTLKCWQALHTLVYESADILPVEVMNGFLSQCVTGLRDLVTATRDQIKKDQAGETPTDEKTVQAPESAGIEPAVGTSDASETSSGTAEDSLSETVALSEAGFTRPEWITEQDWNTANGEERDIMLEDKEAYLEELELMKKANELADAGSNEPAKTG